MAVQTASLTVRSPWDGALAGEAPLTPPGELATILDAAAGAQLPRSRHERAELLFAVAERLGAERASWASLITSESGLSLKDTSYEVGRAIDVFRFAAMEALRDEGETFACDTSPHGRDRRAHTLRVPVGLCAAIAPFNHPLNQVAHKVAPAIAAGTSIVCKPSEKTPLTALRLGALLAELGAGDAVRILCAEPQAFADTALEHAGVDVLSFTGGVRVGKALAARLGYRRAILELGGNDPLVVLGDADLDEAAALAVSGAFKNSGQRCTAVKRILAVDAIADELVERIVERTAALRWGDPTDPDTDVGTVIDEDAAIAIAARVQDATDRGARLLHGGEREGAGLAPAVLDHVPADAPLVATETFGPVAPVVRVRDLDDAIAVANGTPYGLSAGVCTSDWRAISRCVQELRCGTVNVREVPGYRTELTPFGGVGDSGLGVKEGVREAMRALSTTRLYTLPWETT